jgi:hypothetical protein
VNDITLNQLKVIVERSMRTVRVSADLGWRMRQELLAHVVAVFEEEAAQGGDDNLALDRTVQRLGNPAELAEQLQDSAPKSDRWVRFFEYVFAGVGVSRLRLVVHYALFGVLLGSILLAVKFTQQRSFDWPVVVLLTVVPFFCVILVDQMREALFGPRGPSWPKVVLISFVPSCAIPGITFGLCWAVSGDWRAGITDTLPLLDLWALLIPATLIVVAYVFAVDAPTRQEWAKLRLD